jgi:hypothetical protein
MYSAPVHGVMLSPLRRVDLTPVSTHSQWLSGDVLIGELACSGITGVVTGRSDLGCQSTDERSLVVPSICPAVALHDLLPIDCVQLCMIYLDYDAMAPVAFDSRVLVGVFPGSSLARRMNSSLGPSSFTAACISQLCAVMSRRYGFSFEGEDR